jgi:hypothetical protein
MRGGVNFSGKTCVRSKSNAFGVFFYLPAHVGGTTYERPSLRHSLLGLSLNLVQSVRLGLSFRLRYYSGLSERFLEKELNLFFVPLGASRMAAGPSALRMELQSSMIRPFTPTPQTMLVNE